MHQYFSRYFLTLSAAPIRRSFIDTVHWPIWSGRQAVNTRFTHDRNEWWFQSLNVSGMSSQMHSATKRRLSISSNNNCMQVISRQLDGCDKANTLVNTLTDALSHLDFYFKISVMKYTARSIRLILMNCICHQRQVSTGLLTGLSSYSYL